MNLSLPQRLALVQFLTDRLKELRKDDLLPQAAREMPPGARLPVSFGGQHVGWASMPQPSRTASVTDEAAFLAWAEEHQPGKVETVTEVVVDSDLIAFLDDHRPQALRESRRVNPQWVSDLLAGLKAGRYVTRDGDILTEVPGVTAGASSPSPRVNLNDDAASAIGQAWRAGNIPAAEFLALPSGEEADVA